MSSITLAHFFDDAIIEHEHWLSKCWCLGHTDEDGVSTSHVSDETEKGSWKLGGSSVDTTFTLNDLVAVVSACGSLGDLFRPSSSKKYVTFAVPVAPGVTSNERRVR